MKDILDEHYAQEVTVSTQDMLEKMKKEWKCKECAEGYLEIFLYGRLDETWYFRRCHNFPHCKNRTKSQKYDPTKVKGIVKNTEIPEKKT